jgi:hypothetical protein
MKSSASIFSLGALATLCVGSATARAQTATDSVVFETIDTYALATTSSYATLSVSGVVQGATVATTQAFTLDSGAGASSCDRIMAIAMNRPGRFLVTVERISNQGALSRACRLTRRP